MFSIPRIAVLDGVVDDARRHVDDALPYLLGRGASVDQVAALGIGLLRSVPSGLGDGEEARRLASWLRSHVPPEGAFVFPTHDLLGRVVGLQIRHVAQKSYGDFRSSRSRASDAFFGAPLARRAVWERRRAIVVEGVFDWFPVQRVHAETLCILGTDISRSQVRSLHRLCDAVFFLYDNDDAGDEAYERAIKLFGQEPGRKTLLQRVRLLGGKDPGEVWETLGEKETCQRLRRVLP